MDYEGASNRNIEEINYLEVHLDSSGKWDKQKKVTQQRGNQALSAIDRCLAKTPCIDVRTLEKMYEMLVEARMYGVEVWGIHEAWKEMDVFHTRFFKKILGVRRCTANSSADLELGRDSSRSSIMIRVLKYW
jgi:hypothetical protein